MAFVQGDGKTTPFKQLFDFQKVHLEPGQQVEVFLTGGPNAFSRVTERGEKIVEPGKRKV